MRQNVIGVRGFAMKAFIERYADKILGVITCFDRVVITGTLLEICYADGMAALSSSHSESSAIILYKCCWANSVINSSSHSVKTFSLSIRPWILVVVTDSPLN